LTTLHKKENAAPLSNSRGKGQSVVAAAAYQRREQEEERQPGRSIADDWLDSQFRKSDDPTKTRVELRTEQLHQHRGQRRKPTRR